MSSATFADHFPGHFAERLERLRAALKPGERNDGNANNNTPQYDAFWVSHPANISYLCGFANPADGKLLLLPDQVMFYSDQRYQIEAAALGLPFFIGRPKEVLAHAKALVAGLHVGFEAEHLSYGNYARFFDGWHCKLTGTYGLIEQQRTIKDAAEIANLREAARITDVALAAVMPNIVAGASEITLLRQLEAALLHAGAAGNSFDGIVASGIRGALPHGGSTDKLLADGELVTIDFGGLYNGYHADMTRTIAIGEVSDSLKSIYQTVEAAHTAALAAIQPGVSTKAVDQAAREVIIAAGYGEHFNHGLGHGVGLAIHEGPSLNQHSEDVLAAGMTVTIEPGIYIEGIGGVRIEDLVLVTETGFEFLSHSPKISL
jgi:Xaa-Pro aminopeptidase